MRPNAANRGGSISSGNNRSSGFGGGGFDDGGDVSFRIYGKKPARSTNIFLAHLII